MNTDTNQLFMILKQKYIMNMSQREIAEINGISTATVSRAIKEGVERGYVQISLNLPGNYNHKLEHMLLKKYNLQMVTVIKNELNDRTVILDDVARACAQYLDSIIKNGMLVGVSWGRTMLGVTKHVARQKLNDLKFITLSGGVSSSRTDTSVTSIVDNFANAYNAIGYSLALPMYLKNESIAEAIKTDAQFKNIYDMLDQLQIAIFSVGAVDNASLLYEEGYISNSKIKLLREEGYVGDICARFYKPDGSYPDSTVNIYSTGINLDQLRAVPQKICVVAGKEKSMALKGALNGNLVDVLFVDETTAENLL
ncbi:MAG: sugar-binding transcriptional regulator [Lachnospiraceae bacterium]|jgi:deoxyribonucleoside regulator